MFLHAEACSFFGCEKIFMDKFVNNGIGREAGPNPKQGKTRAPPVRATLSLLWALPPRHCEKTALAGLAISRATRGSSKERPLR